MTVFQVKGGVVTGATSGIGEATAKAFAQAGAKVAFNGRRANLGRQVKAAIRAQGSESIYLQTDVRDPDQVRWFFREVENRYGRLDIAFNNTGIVCPNAPIAEQSLDNWHRCDGHQMYKEYWLCMKEEIPLMLKQGRGHIINLALALCEYSIRQVVSSAL